MRRLLVAAIVVCAAVWQAEAWAACRGTAPPCGQCSAAVCSAEGLWECIARTGTACNDNNACTTSDHCSAGACVGTPVSCPSAPDQCHDASSCNPSTGLCSAAPNKQNGTPC